MCELSIHQSQWGSIQCVNNDCANYPGIILSKTPFVIKVLLVKRCAMMIQGCIGLESLKSVTEKAALILSILFYLFVLHHLIVDRIENKRSVLYTRF